MRLVVLVLLAAVVLVTRLVPVPAPIAAGGSVQAGPGVVLEVLDGDTVIVRMEIGRAHV